MTSPRVPLPDLSAEANRRYWHSEVGVNRIAEELSLSKGALYDLLQPLPAGTDCAVCGAEVVYPNRTARDRDLAECLRCGSVPARDSRPVAATERPAETGPAGGSGPGSSGGGSLRLLGGIFLGSALVLVARRWIRR